MSQNMIQPAMSLIGERLSCNEIVGQCSRTVGVAVGHGERSEVQVSILLCAPLNSF